RSLRVARARGRTTPRSTSRPATTSRNAPKHVSSTGATSVPDADPTEAAVAGDPPGVGVRTDPPDAGVRAGPAEAGVATDTVEAGDRAPRAGTVPGAPAAAPSRPDPFGAPVAGDVTRGSQDQGRQSSPVATAVERARASS